MSENKIEINCKEEVAYKLLERLVSFSREDKDFLKLSIKQQQEYEKKLFLSCLAAVNKEDLELPDIK